MLGWSLLCRNQCLRREVAGNRIGQIEKLNWWRPHKASVSPIGSSGLHMVHQSCLEWAEVVEPLHPSLICHQASLVVQTVKNLHARWETWVWFLGRKNPLEKEMATHASIVAWKIPQTEEPGGLYSMGLQKVRRDWVANTHSVSGKVTVTGL